MGDSKTAMSLNSLPFYFYLFATKPATPFTNTYLRFKLCLSWCTTQTHAKGAYKLLRKRVFFMYFKAFYLFFLYYLLYLFFHLNLLFSIKMGCRCTKRVFCYLVLNDKDFLTFLFNKMDFPIYYIILFNRNLKVGYYFVCSRLFI